MGRSSTMIYRYWSILVNKNKQVNVINSNIIYFLDIFHLISILYYGKDSGFSPVITAHDCFGTLPNKLENLSFIVRKEFIIQYLQEDFLILFDNRVRQYIRDYNYLIDGNKIFTDENTYEIPKLLKLDTLDLKEIESSTYMIT